MKIWKWILTPVIAATLVFAGCGKKGGVDTAQLESSFKSAEASLQTAADKAVAAVKAGDHSAALAELQRLAKEAKLTPEQQQALKDVTAQVQKALIEAAGKASGEASKAIGDATKSLPK